ncbi:MAG TPA: M56 family metallopeptidase, partial [Puia sp.]|nr:M56 family metallopeptidase [Puia sp.]
MTIIPETIIRALCWTLLHSLWQGMILAVTAGIVMVLTKRASSATRYTGLSLMVAAFLLVSAYTFVREWRGATVNRGQVAAVHPAAISQGLRQGDQASTGAQGVTALEQLVQYFNAHASAVVVLWFIVFMARLIKVLSGLVYAQRVRHYQTSAVGAGWQEKLAALLQRLRITRPVLLLESALIGVPVVVGWLKPAILVPVGMLAQLPPEQVETILLHELAHISRKDYLFNFLQHLVDTLFFFNPALLWVSSLIRQERENCCDDVAIRETRSRRKLVQALVSFHEYQQGARGYALGFAGQRGSLLKRVERIVHKKNHSLNAGERALLMGGVMLLCGAFITINGTTREARLRHATETASTKNTVSAASPARATKASVQLSGAIHRRLGTGTLSFTGNIALNLRSNVQVSSTEVAGARGEAVGASTEMAGASAKGAAATSEAVAAGPDTTAPGGTMTKAEVDLIIRAHEHGVTTEFVTEMKNLGYTVTLEEAIRLKDHGVTEEFLESLQKEGYAHISLQEAVRLVDHGVT